MKKIPEEHWEYLLKTERAAAEKFILNQGYEIEDYNKFRNAYLSNTLEEYKREEEKEMAKSKADPKEIIKLYKEGVSLYAISKQLRVGPPMIKKILGENGLIEAPKVEKKAEIKIEEEPKKIEEPKINNPKTDLDHIAANLTEEELRGFIKGNVITLLSTDLVRAEEYLSWYNRR